MDCDSFALGREVCSQEALELGLLLWPMASCPQTPEAPVVATPEEASADRWLGQEGKRDSQRPRGKGSLLPHCLVQAPVLACPRVRADPESWSVSIW